MHSITLPLPQTADAVASDLTLTTADTIVGDPTLPLMADSTASDSADVAASDYRSDKKLMLQLVTPPFLQMAVAVASDSIPLADS